MFADQLTTSQAASPPLPHPDQNAVPPDAPSVIPTFNSPIGHHDQVEPQNGVQSQHHLHPQNQLCNRQGHSENRTATHNPTDCQTQPPIPPNVPSQSQVGPHRHSGAEESLDDFPRPVDKRPEDYETMYQQAKKDLQAANQKLSDQNQKLTKLNGKYKGVSRELNRVIVKSESHKVHQVTDEGIDTEVGQLRYAIKNFAVHCSGDNSLYREIRQLKQQHEEYNVNYLGITGWELFSALMQSPSKLRPLVMEALIWTILCDKVFNAFGWVDEDISKGLQGINKLLGTRACEASSQDPEAKYQYNRWRAKTSIATLEAPAEAQEHEQRSIEKQMCDETATKIFNFLAPFGESDHAELWTQILQIVQTALSLDKLLQKQVAKFDWIDNIRGCLGPENFECVEGTEPIATESAVNWLVVSPGLVKAGKSTGEDFDRMSLFFKVKVADISGFRLP
ncbi:hypothetical protein PG994_002700 [Apiospora phragmitis]|uniref:Uncharacterized protein n=1 Tax=Apiospora phragmitis TaxID=2905665 RepID=A0ABR1W616_9PEZI